MAFIGVGDQASTRVIGGLYYYANTVSELKTLVVSNWESLSRGGRREKVRGSLVGNRVGHSINT